MPAVSSCMMGAMLEPAVIAGLSLLLRTAQCIVIEPRTGHGTAHRTDGHGSYLGYLSKDAIFSAYRKLLVEQGEQA